MAETKYRDIRTSRANDVIGTIKRTFSYIGIHYKGRFILAIIFILLSSLAGVVSSYLFTPIIDSHIKPYIGVTNPDLSGLVNMIIILSLHSCEYTDLSVKYYHYYIYMCN